MNRYRGRDYLSLFPAAMRGTGRDEVAKPWHDRHVSEVLLEVVGWHRVWILSWIFHPYAFWSSRRCMDPYLVWVCLCTSIGCQKFQFSFVRETKAHSFDEVFCLVTSWSCFCYVLNRDMITSSRTGENQPFCALLWDNNISKQHT
jgi:hypothetical protein